MAEFVESESDFRKVKNALLSGSIHIGSPADLKTIAKLFVRTGSISLGNIFGRMAVRSRVDRSSRSICSRVKSIRST